MKKKKYEKPTMQVVKLQHTMKLLQASADASMPTTWTEEDV